MKKIKILGAIFAAMLMSTTIIACGDDEPQVPGNGTGTGLPNDNNNNNDNSDDPDPDVDALADKQYLEDTATEFISSFNASDQEAVLKFAQFYLDELSELEFPESFYDDDAARSMMRVITSKSYLKIGRGVANYTISMARIAGVYEPNFRKDIWELVSESKDCILKFYDDNNRLCEISVSAASNSTWTYSRTIDGDNFKFDIPKKLVLVIKQGGSTILQATVESDFVDRSKADVSVNVEFANVKLKSETVGSSSSIKENMSLVVSGKTLISTSATVEGNNLCSVDTWENYFDRYDESEAVSRMVSGGTARISIMNRVNINAEITNVKDFIDYVDYWADRYDSSNPERDVKNAANKLKSAVSAKMTYAGSSTVRAILSWEAYQSDSYYEEWTVRPLINFTADNTVYDFESYFGNGRFQSVEDLFENVLDSYEVFFD